MSIFDKLVQVDFPADQYVPEESKKTQICLHHTVSPNNSVKGDIMTWVRSKRRVATSIIIGGDGKIYIANRDNYYLFCFNNDGTTNWKVPVGGQSAAFPQYSYSHLEIVRHPARLYQK